MKKLMFAAALALGASCFAAGESIESNVVGYQQYDLKQGYNFITAVFEKTTPNADGTKNLDIQDFKLTGDNIENSLSSSEYIQIVGIDGKFGKRYQWYNGDTEGNAMGWYWVSDDGSEIEYASEPLDLGNGFYLYVVGKDVKLQTSGAVSLAQQITSLEAGYNIVGNATPQAITFQDIKLFGDNLSNSLSSSEYLQIVGTDGKFGKRYQWYSGDDEGNVMGWYWVSDDGSEIEYAADEPVEPGQAFYIYVVGSGNYVQIKSPLTK